MSRQVIRQAPDNAPNRHSGPDSDSLIVVVAAGSAASRSLWTRLHGDGGRQLGATGAPQLRAARTTTESGQQRPIVRPSHNAAPTLRYNVMTSKRHYGKTRAPNLAASPLLRPPRCAVRSAARGCLHRAAAAAAASASAVAAAAQATALALGLGRGQHLGSLPRSCAPRSEKGGAGWRTLTFSFCVASRGALGVIETSGEDRARSSPGAPSSRVAFFLPVGLSQVEVHRTSGMRDEAAAGVVACCRPPILSLSRWRAPRQPRRTPTWCARDMCARSAQGLSEGTASARAHVRGAQPHTRPLKSDRVGGHRVQPVI